MWLPTMVAGTVQHLVPANTTFANKLIRYSTSPSNQKLLPLSLVNNQEQDNVGLASNYCPQKLIIYIKQSIIFLKDKKYDVILSTRNNKHIF